MIEEVVTSILDAEDKAKAMVVSAEENAAQVVVEAEKLAESKLKQASEDNKAYQFAQMSKADAEANAQASAALAQAKEQTDLDIQKYVANVDKAVSAILERVL